MMRLLLLLFLWVSPATAGETVTSTAGMSQEDLELARHYELLSNWELFQTWELIELYPVLEEEDE